MSNFYSDFYYSDDYYDGLAIDVPLDLDYYRTDNDGIYVFHWTFNPQYITPVLATLDFELQLDTVSTFDSPNFKSFLKTTAILYQNGNVVKGYTVPVYTRVEDDVITFYARVRVKDGVNYSNFSDILTAETIQNVVRSTEDRLLTALPDGNVYPIDEVNLPLNQRTSNISKIYQDYSLEFDREFLEKENTIWDRSLRFIRDERIYDVFGFRFGFPKPSTMQFVDYRYCLRHVQNAVFIGSTYGAVKEVGKGFTGINPIIVPFDQLTNFITAKVTTVTTIIPGSSPFVVTLTSSPKNVPSIPGFTYVGDPNDTPTPPAPTAGQFTFNHLTNVLTFNSADAGTSITISFSNSSDIYTYLVSPTTQSVVIPGSPFQVTLSGLPIDIPKIIGFTFTNDIPTLNQFNVDFNTGVLTFNSGNAGNSISIVYTPSVPEPPVVFSRQESGFAVEVILQNPGGFSIDLSSVQFLMSQVMPANVRFVLIV